MQLREGRRKEMRVKPIKNTVSSVDRAENITRLPTAELNLDYRNPRLVGEDGQNNQQKLLEILWKKEALDELALSIAQNGFFKEEPLLVVKEEGRPHSC